MTLRTLLRFDPNKDLFRVRTGQRLRKLFSPKWVANRLALAWYQTQNPEAPWLTPEAVGLFEKYLRPEHRGVEFGAGRGTVWIARRCAALRSIDHDVSFHARAVSELATARLANVDARLVVEAAYLEQLADVPDASLDFAVLDGVLRGEALHAVWPKLKPGAMLIFDDVQWYLPSESTTPQARSLEDGPDASIHPGDFLALQNAELKWTTDGTRDTAVITKPVS